MQGLSLWLKCTTQEHSQFLKCSMFFSLKLDCIYFLKFGSSTDHFSKPYPKLDPNEMNKEGCSQKSPHAKLVWSANIHTCTYLVMGKGNYWGVFLQGVRSDNKILYFLKAICPSMCNEVNLRPVRAGSHGLSLTHESRLSRVESNL